MRGVRTERGKGDARLGGLKGIGTARIGDVVDDKCQLTVPSDVSIFRWGSAPHPGSSLAGAPAPRSASSQTIEPLGELFRRLPSL